MHSLVEVVAGLAVPTNHLLGDDGPQKRPHLVAKNAVFIGEFNPCEIHKCRSFLVLAFAVGHHASHPFGASGRVATGQRPTSGP